MMEDFLVPSRWYEHVFRWENDMKIREFVELEREGKGKKDRPGNFGKNE